MYHEMQCWGKGYYGQNGQGTADNAGDLPGEMGMSIYVDYTTRHLVLRTERPRDCGQRRRLAGRNERLLVNIHTFRVSDIVQI